MSRGDFPEWIDNSLARAFGDDRVLEMQALATRAPLDIRANTLKATREQVQDGLAHLAPVWTPHSPVGLRVALGEDGRGPALHSEPEFLKGWFEIQDEGSQLAALLTAVKPGEQVVDLCAGAGGKTLAMAALMANKGQIHATDTDARRLAPIHERLARAGARNVQVRTPRGRGDPVADLDGTADCVLVDAPCTGSGTWRRNPDSKWRLRPGSLEVRRKEQDAVLDARRAAGAPRRPHRLRHLLGAAGGERRRGGAGPPGSSGAAGQLEPPRARTRDPPRGLYQTGRARPSADAEADANGCFLYRSVEASLVVGL